MAIVNLMSGATIHKLDGRHERVRKGKESVINAIIELVTEGRVNLTAADIAAVMSHVQSTVEHVHGIRLYSEVCLVGFPADLMTRFSHPSHTSEPHVAAKKNLQSLLGERA